MNFCSTCGAKLVIGARFCSSCGNAIETNSTESAGAGLGAGLGSGKVPNPMELCDIAYEFVDNGELYKARDHFLRSLESGWPGAAIGLLAELSDLLSFEDAMEIANKSLGMNQPGTIEIRQLIAYELAPKIMLDELARRRQLISQQSEGSTDGVDALMELARETGEYFEQVRADLTNWPEKVDSKTVAYFGQLGANHFSVFDLRGMPLRHHGLLLIYLELIALNSQSPDGAMGAKSKIRDVIATWGDKIPSTVLLTPSALRVFETYNR